MIISFLLILLTVCDVHSVTFYRKMNLAGDGTSDEHARGTNLTTDTSHNLQTLLVVSIEPIETACKAYMHQFGVVSSHFVECSVEYARPFRFCEECVVPYKLSMVIYDEIVKNDDHFSQCHEKLLKADRVQVLNQVYGNIDSVWNDAKCSECFSSILYDNGTVSYEIDNTTAEFVQQFEKMNECIALNNTSVKDVPMNTTICTRCRGKYKRLNDLYNKLSEISNNGICMDIVDMMNYTKQKWGSELNCSSRTVDVAPIIVIAVIVFLMPVIFYISNRIYGQKQYRKLMTQKRMTRQAVNTLYGAPRNSTREGLLSQNPATPSRTNV